MIQRGIFSRHWYVPPLLAAVALAVLFSACGDPLSADIPRRYTPVNFDSLLLVDTVFQKAPGDSIYATINGSQVVFATDVQRPFHNGVRNGGFYVTVAASRYQLLNSRDYQTMSLRIDDVRDTGTFVINAPYSAPKTIDSLDPPQYGAAYQSRSGTDYPVEYGTGTPRSSGTIRVLIIDRKNKVMIGSFSFIGYSDRTDTTLEVSRGAFRLHLVE